MKKVLIVDDAATVRMYHRNILKNHGFDTQEALNGLEALEKSHTDSFDLYLVDVNMPMMDGYSFVRALRASDSISQAPVLMISTEAEADDETRAYEAGANLYLIKPVQPDQLVEYASLLVGEGV